MSKIKNIFYIFIIAINIFSMNVLYVSAQKIDAQPQSQLTKFATTGDKSAGYTGGGSIASYVGSALNGLYGLLGVAGMILIIYAGFMWMFARGNETKITEAKNIITSTIIGLAILVGAYAITGFIIEALT